MLASELSIRSELCTNAALLGLLDLVVGVKLYILALLRSGKHFSDRFPRNIARIPFFPRTGNISPTQVINSVDEQSCIMATFVSSPWAIAPARFNQIVSVKVYPKRKL